MTSVLGKCFIPQKLKAAAISSRKGIVESMCVSGGGGAVLKVDRLMIK